jgi:hypothetical protein
MNLKNKYFVAFLAIVLFSLFLRLYNFENRVLYGPEQGISLLSAGENLKNPSLLGIPYLLRSTSVGHRLFTAPTFGYSLVPFIYLFNYDPVGITSIFVLVNVLTGVVLYFVVRRIWDEKLALFSSVIFLFSAHMIYHSLFIWTSNYMPLVGILTLYGFYKYLKSRKIKWVFLLGFISGIGFGLQYLYLFGLLVVLALLLKYSRKKVAILLYFLSGGVLGELPTVLFDLKHDFYHTRVLWQYFVDTLNVPGNSQFSYYHILVLWPLFAIVAAYMLVRIYKRSKFLTLFIIVLYIFFNLKSPRVNFNEPVGMPERLTAGDILQVSKRIAEENPENFNVSVLMNFDFRGYVLRYPLEFIYKEIPMEVEEYPQSQELYVLAPKDYNFDEPDLWEISSFHAQEVTKLSEVKEVYGLFKLTK